MIVIQTPVDTGRDWETERSDPARRAKGDDTRSARQQRYLVERGHCSDLHHATVSAPVAEKSKSERLAQLPCVQPYCRKVRPETAGAASETPHVSGRNGPSIRNRSRPCFRNRERQEECLSAHARGAGKGIPNFNIRIAQRRLSTAMQRASVLTCGAKTVTNVYRSPLRR